MAEIQRDITRSVLAVIFILALIGSSIWILWPFLGVIVWAGTIVVASWPVMISLQFWFWGKRGLAVAVMTVLLLCVLVVPLTLAIGTILSNADEIGGWVKSLANLKMPSPPQWVEDFPFIGARAVKLWEDVGTAGIQEVTVRAAPYAGSVMKWVGAQLGGIGILLVEFLLTVILAAAMYAKGELAIERLTKFGRRLAGGSGENAVFIAGQTIRAVALGVVATSVAQTIFGGFGLMVAGVPFAGILTAMMLLLSIAQIGVIPVLGSAVAWLYWTGASGWGTFMLIWTIIAGTIDNFLRPLLIKKGADLPLLLIFAGVVGGLLSFGLIGIFVGPVVLAVANALFRTWLDGDSREPTWANRVGSMAQQQDGNRPHRRAISDEDRS